MLILSWNVAGLSTTLQRIHSDYNVINESGTSKTSFQTDATQGENQAKKKNSIGAQFLTNYFSLHQADIICFQEHKISTSTITSRNEPFSCCTATPGYESYWSCCVDQNKRGFNGVCTFAKVGTTLCADSSILGEKDLDDQGRCIMTDHGAFVLFNVYVPALGGNSLSFKMRFLNALRRAMKKQRDDLGRHVILVGDLNIAHIKEDVVWDSRKVDVNEVLKEVADTSTDNQLPTWKKDLEKYWEKITAALETKRAVAIKTKNVSTGAQFDKYRISVKLPNNQEVFLGKAEENPDYAMQCYDLNLSYTYYDEDLNQERTILEPNLISVRTLTELMGKIGKVYWNESTQRLIADTDADINGSNPGRQWLDKVIEEDGMVDVFRQYYPKAKGRFTCWSQQTNARYDNLGVRIDYTLVDKSLLPYVCKGNVPSLRCYTQSCDSSIDKESYSLTEEAAFQAATANGAFQGASFLGGGIASASQSTLDTQFGAPHSGIVYTPPTYSDHVGVSLLLNETCSDNQKNKEENEPNCEEKNDKVDTLDLKINQLLEKALSLNEKDPKTKKAQPFKAQQSIKSFFSAGTKQENISKLKDTKSKIGNTSSKSNIHVSSQSTKRKIIAKEKTQVKTQKKRNTLHNFFKK